MNVFVLNTGRCGSTTFIRACEHIVNYTAAHESRCGMLGEQRLAYPKDHIEADNRLSWCLGRLGDRFGDDAMYVHLRRDRVATAESFVKRYDSGIIKAYREGILLGVKRGLPSLQVSLDYCETVDANIEYFLRDKPHVMAFQLENARVDFVKFWKDIGAEGDLSAALSEFSSRHNASPCKKRVATKSVQAGKWRVSALWKSR